MAKKEPKKPKWVVILSKSFAGLLLALFAVFFVIEILFVGLLGSLINRPTLNSIVNDPVVVDSLTETAVLLVDDRLQQLDVVLPLIEEAELIQQVRSIITDETLRKNLATALWDLADFATGIDERLELDLPTAELAMSLEANYQAIVDRLPTCSDEDIGVASDIIFCRAPGETLENVLARAGTTIETLVRQIIPGTLDVITPDDRTNLTVQLDHEIRERFSVGRNILIALAWAIAFELFVFLLLALILFTDKMHQRLTIAGYTLMGSAFVAAIPIGLIGTSISNVGQRLPESPNKELIAEQLSIIIDRVVTSVFAYMNSLIAIVILVGVALVVYGLMLKRRK